MWTRSCQPRTRPLGIATGALNERLALLNEFRAQQADESKKYLTRDEYNVAHRAMSDKIDALTKQVYIVVGSMAVLYLLLHFLGGKP